MSLAVAPPADKSRHSATPATSSHSSTAASIYEQQRQRSTAPSPKDDPTQSPIPRARSALSYPSAKLGIPKQKHATTGFPQKNSPVSHDLLPQEQIAESRSLSQGLPSANSGDHLATPSQDMEDANDANVGPESATENLNQPPDIQPTSVNDDDELDAELTEDDRVCEKMYALVAAVEEFAKLFPLERNEHLFDQLIDSPHIHLVRYIGCLALAGNNGEESWKQLLADGECRQALVVGIVGRAMQEFVFSSLYFGTSEEVTNLLEEQEILWIDDDGFVRQRERANLIAAQSHPPKALRKALLRLTLQMETLLLPLFSTQSFSTAHPSPLRGPLAALLETAAHLSRTMRSEHWIIYQCPPTFKDEQFDPARMEARNLAALFATTPWMSTPGTDEATLAADAEGRHQMVVRIVGFPGLVAYRGGGDGVARLALALEKQTHSRYPQDVRAARKGQERTADDGFRTRVLVKAGVQMAWGRQSLLAQEAGTSRHLEAMASGDMSRYENEERGRMDVYAVYVKRLLGKGKEKEAEAGAEAEQVDAMEVDDEEEGEDA